MFLLLFFFHHTSTTEIYTLSLHDALPISSNLALMTSSGVPRSISACVSLRWATVVEPFSMVAVMRQLRTAGVAPENGRSEEHTSELQSLRHLVCRLLLEKKNRR